MFTGFIKLNRCNKTEELMKDIPCFMLLSLIAYRAKRKDDFSINNLKIGEALIGDYKAVGLTRQQYRTSLKKLENWGFVTTKTTNKGTVATLLDSEVYNINLEDTNQQNNHTSANEKPSANHQTTTNKNIRSKEVKKEDISLSELQQKVEQLEAANAALERELTVFQTEEEKPKAKSKAFVPPTPLEVKNYFIERTQVNGRISETFAEKFIAHYEEKNWTYSGKKMKDWKRAVVSSWNLEKFIHEHRHLENRSNVNTTRPRYTNPKDARDVI